MRAGWKHHRTQTKLTRRFIPSDIHFYIHIWGLHFSLFLLRLKCFWIWGQFASHAKPHEMGFVFCRQVAKLLQRGLCLAAGLWIRSTVTAQRQATYLTLWPHNLEAHIGSPRWWQLQSVSVVFHWQTKGSRRACCSTSLLCEKKKPLVLDGWETVKWLLQSLEYWLSSPFFRVDQASGKKFWPSQTVHIT